MQMLKEWIGKVNGNLKVIIIAMLIAPITINQVSALVDKISPKETTGSTVVTATILNEHTKLLERISGYMERQTDLMSELVDRSNDTNAMLKGAVENQVTKKRFTDLEDAIYQLKRK